MLFFFDIGYAVSEVERAVESFRLDSRTFERRVEITSCRSRGFLTLGEDPARLRMPGRSRVDVVTTHERTGVITETDSVFVMTEADSIEVA